MPSSRRQQDDPERPCLEIPTPARQEQERKPGYGGNSEEHRGREDGLEHAHAGSQVGFAVRVEVAHHGEVRPHEGVPGHDVLHDAAEGPGEEARQHEPDGEDKTIDAVGGEPAHSQCPAGLSRKAYT